jgi:CRP-like cAMP-binding protein
VTAPQTIGPVERALWLRSAPPFTGLRARLLAALAQLTHEDLVRAGRSVRPLGRVSRSVRFLMDGRLRAHVEGGATQVLEAPQVIGLTELLAGRDLRAGLTADTDVTILTVGGAQMIDLLEEEFTLVTQVRRGLGRALAAAQAARADWAPEAAAAPPPAPHPDLDQFVDRMLALHNVPLLRRFGVAVLATLLRDEAACRLAAGDIIFRCGDAADRLVVIGDGRVVGTMPDGRTFGAGPGVLLGDNEALTALPYACTVAAETAATIIALDPRVIWDAAEDHFHVARALLGDCARRLLRLEGGLIGSVDALVAPPPTRPQEAA